MHTHRRHWNTPNGLPCRRIKHETKSCMSYNLQNMCRFLHLLSLCLFLSLDHFSLHSLSLLELVYFQFQILWDLVSILCSQYMHTYKSTATHLHSHLTLAHANLAKWYIRTSHTFCQKQQRNIVISEQWLWYIPCGCWTKSASVGRKGWSDEIYCGI